MKLISLNIWGGHELNPLLEFIKKESIDTDIFCFQEVFDADKTFYSKQSYKSDILKDLKKVLRDFNCYFALTLENYFFQEQSSNSLKLGLTIFIKKDIQVLETGDEFIFQKLNQVTKNKDSLFVPPENMQYIKFVNEKSVYLVTHLHGLVFPGNKKDSPDRIKQSQKIKEFLDKQTGKVILIGDFNLNPSTKSIKILEKGMTNLIKTFKIKQTRSKLNKQGKQRFADYAFTSKEIKVKDFLVPENILVSDHLPLILNFS